MSKKKKAEPIAAQPVSLPAGFIQLTLWTPESTGTQVFVKSDSIAMLADLKAYKKVNGTTVTLDRAVQFFVTESMEQVMAMIKESKL